MIGQKFGRYLVICVAENSAAGKKRWLCRCECGVEKIVVGTQLRNGHSQSCGCLRRERAWHPPVIDMTGQRFSRLVVVRQSPLWRHGCAQWECLCDCGERVTVNGHTLRNGNTRSCGCLMRTHGESGPDRSPEYATWKGIKRRCSAPRCKDYKDYGGRGIRVCDRWLNSFENFLADMGRKPSPKHSIDRADNDGNYEPGNCRWATPSEQSKNRRPYKLKRRAAEAAACL